MKVLHETYLEQMAEELEIINFKLNTLYENAKIQKSDESIEVSLFESIKDSDIVFDTEKYQLYSESLNTVLKNIWKAIRMFIKSLFTSAGEVISKNDAKNIISILKDASDTGNIDSKMAKKYVQKAFYMIAGLSTSVDGGKLKEAYNSGDIIRYVMNNVDKINIDKIPDDATFRIAVGSYANVNIDYGIIYKILSKIRDSGIQGIISEGEKMINSTKYKENLKKLAKGIGKNIDILLLGLLIVSGLTAGLISNARHKKAKTNKDDPIPAKFTIIESANPFSETAEKLQMAIATFINEDKPDAIVKIRLFNSNKSDDIDIIGREKVSTFRDDLVGIADKLINFDEYPSEQIEDAMKNLGQNINLFFAGLVNKG